MTSVPAGLSAALADRYRVERQLGQGGMATVYLAEDLKHKRKVALKVLKPELAAMLGAERFVQEITTTAALQHPHILPLFDSGSADGFLYYVMPFIDGETLRAKLDRETQLGIDAAVKIAAAVADALDYAHRRGVIHRDIKPENILLHDGRPMVADFGIALALSAAAGGRMTETGMSLGTPHYMSPEQATAEKEITARSDVYSLASVLYEMLTGNPPHTGASAQQIIMRIVTEDPAPVTKLRKAVPPNVAAAVARALEKLPADRFPSAGTFAEALANPAFRAATGAAGTEPARAGGAVSRRAYWTTVSLAALLLLSVLAWALRRPSAARDPATTAPVYQTTIVIPDSTPLAYIGSGPLGVGTRAFAVSPDGTTLVFVGQSGGTTRLYVRPLDGSSVSPLAGTEGAYAPFFSPDSKSVGFFAAGHLNRTSLTGGGTVSLADVSLPYGAVWLPDGRILVAADEGESLLAIQSSGGTPHRLGRDQAFRAVFPEPLPGDREILMSTVEGHLAVVSTSTGRAVLLGPRGPTAADSITATSALFAGTHPKYVASGHILYHSLDGAVMALPFDPASDRALGPPTPVLFGVRLESIWGAGQLLVTRDGTLIYARGENGRLTSLVWRDQRGRVDTLTAFGRADYGALDLSADGTRLLAYVCQSQGTCASHVLNLVEGVDLSLGGDGRWEYSSGPIGWWDRGQRVFAWQRHPSGNDASAGTTHYYSPEDPARSDSLPGIRVYDVASDGSVLFGRGDSLFVAASTAELRESRPGSGFQLPERDAWGHQLRPGGEWIAYSASSAQAGEYVVFIARTRPPFERWRASPRGGEEPVWGREGELVYREGNRWMSVAPPASPGARPGVARFLFTGPYLNVLGRSHDIAPDGRHLLIAGPEQTTTTTLTVVTNWLSRLPAKAPAR